MPNRLQALRQKMHRAGIQACLIPSTDPHQSEYVAEHWQLRSYFSGFTGSAGKLLITLDRAALWTDGRYFLQAEQQLPPDILLMKEGLPETPSIPAWLQHNLQQGDTLGIDGWQFSHRQYTELKKQLQDKKLDIRIDFNPWDELWPDRPPLPDAPIFDFPEEFAGESREKKLQRLRKNMFERKIDYLLLSALDEIAWLFNLRGRDVHCNPVFYAYTLIGQDEALLFLPYASASKCPSELQAHLAKAGIQIREYEQITTALKDKLPSQARLQASREQVNEMLYRALPAHPSDKSTSPVQLMKAVKNETEIAHTRQAMVTDGIALFHFYRWLEETLQHRSVSEAEAAEKINEFRNEQGDFFGPSFDPIVGFRQNGAIVHYKAEAENCAQIQAPGMLLIDSGGQYPEGTTDITRTTYLGTPSEEQKKHFTLVLKGHIALARAIFPKGTTGCQLDILARHALWQEKLNYGHGTGHGVGFFLNVHEGPQRIGPTRSQAVLMAGMITSNEPGYYLQGHYGIRIENLVLCREAGNGFLEFETLTLFPIQLKLIDKDLLTEEEISWLNAYHQKVYEKLSPQLNEEDRNSLREQTRPLN